jgi:hypothetical protein
MTKNGCFYSIPAVHCITFVQVASVEPHFPFLISPYPQASFDSPGELFATAVAAAGDQMS